MRLDLRNRLAAVLGCTITLAACGGEDPTTGSDSSYDTECRAIGGSYSGVAFTDAQAVAVANFADAATLDELRAVPLKASVADAIVAARPFSSVASPVGKLDAISGIGPVTLTTLRDAVDATWCALSDGRQSCCGAGADGVVINEFSAGSSGWVELFNPSASPAVIGGYQLDDVANGGRAPQAIPAGTTIPAKGFFVVSLSGINTASADSVRLIPGPSAKAGPGDYTDNFYAGSSTAGQCFGRSPDGGAWAAGNIPCTQGASNGGSPAPACTAVGGTYKGVAFTKDEECQAAKFLDLARYSQMAAIPQCQRGYAYDCKPGEDYHACGPGFVSGPNYRDGLWTSVAEFAAFSATCAIGATTLSRLKSASATWTDDGLHYDTVASVNAGVSSGITVTLERVWVEKSVSLNAWTSCAQVRDTPQASETLVVCVDGVDAFGESKNCGTKCLDGELGTYRWYRGSFARDVAFPSGKRNMVELNGSGYTDQPGNPSIP